MIPFPKTDYNDIIHDLNHIRQFFDIDNFRFSLREYRKKGLALIKKQPELGFTLLGIVSCVEKKIDEMHSYHQSAVESSGESSFALSQYGCSLMVAGLYEDAMEFALKAYSLVPEDKENLQLVLNLSYILKDEEVYIGFKSRLENLGFEYLDPADFHEDNEEYLADMIKKTDQLIEQRPDLVIEPDLKLEELVDSLVDGVDA